MRCASSLLALLIAAAAIAEEALPPPPAGFEWQRVPEIKAAFLRPSGWFFKRDPDRGKLAFYISKEDINRGGHFDTGLTVVGYPRLKDMSAADFAQRYVRGFARQHVVERVWDASMGPFAAWGCRVTTKDGVTTMHQLMIANPKTNSAYLIIFESPAAEWSQSWTVGNEIIRRLYLDDEF